MMLAVGLVGMLLVLVASQIVAQGPTAAPKQLLDEAKTLYAAHNYDRALERLKQVDRAGLGFFEKGTYDSLLDKTKKAIEGKAADEKALADGKDALSKKNFAVAIEKLSQAAKSPYLPDEGATNAKALLRVAKDGEAAAETETKAKKDQEAKAAAGAKAKADAEARAKVEKAEQEAEAKAKAEAESKAKAVADAKAAVEKAKEALKDGKIADARKGVDQVAAMKVDLGWWGNMDFANLQKKVEKAEAAAKAPVAVAKPAEKPVAAPAKPAGPTASETYAEARKLYGQRNFDEAQKTLQKVKRDELGLFERWGYDGLVKDTQTAIERKAADEKALAEGKDALAKKQYAVAIEKLGDVASSKYLPVAKVDEAKAAYQLAGDEQAKAATEAKAAAVAKAKAAAEAKAKVEQEARTKALAEAKAAAEAKAKVEQEARTKALAEAKAAAEVKAKADQEARAKADQEATAKAKALADAKASVAQAQDALRAGKVADARKLVDQVKASKVGLGWWGNMQFSALERRVARAEIAEAEAASAPKVAAKPPEAKPPVTVAAKPPEQVTPVVAPKPPQPAPVAPALPVPPAPRPEGLTVAQQAKRAQAEEEMKLGDDALARHEYQQAKIRYAKAVELWPESVRAKKGLDDALRLLAEREEPLGDVVRELSSMERQRIIAAVQEMLAQAQRDMERAERVEDYNDALRPLAQADRTIDVARVLSPEEQEALRTDVWALRKEIERRKVDATTLREKKAKQEADLRERTRREADRADRDSKIKQLWDRAKELRHSMQFGEAIEILDRLIAVDPNDERALRWREDLLYLDAQTRQVNVRTERERQAVESLADVEEASIHPGDRVRGKSILLRYPEAKDWKELSQFRKEFTKAVSAEPKAVSETRRRLVEEIDLDFEKTSLDNVLKYIGEVQRGLNIVIDPDVAAAGIDLSTRVVDLKVKRVSIESVLGLILGADLGYKVEPGYILITTKEKLQQNLPVVTYPVQDLVAQIPDFGGEAPRFEVANVTQAASQAAAGGAGGMNLFGGGAAARKPEEEAVGPQELQDIIKRTVNNTSDPAVAAWSDEGGPAAIEYINGLLVVTQTRRGHEKVADLLEQLRRERAIMISVESRFCTVTDEFLQDITLDVDAAFLNVGPRGFVRNPATGVPWSPINNPAAPPPYNTLPGIPGAAGTQFGQPIIVSNTGSNGMGTQTLLPVSGTVFGQPTWTSNFNQGGMVVSGVFLDDIQVGFMLRAIQADVRSTTLQAPRVTLYNGQRSYISVSTVTTYIADVTPVVAEAAVGWDPTIGAIPVGVTLDVKATVSADRRYVQMDLRPQVADIEGFEHSTVTAAVPALGIATATIDLPRVRVQDFKTTVSVPDGGTLLLGGTRQFIEGEAETGVPVLSKIPILKRLFNNRATVRRANNLLILMKPRIIIQAEEEKNLGYDNF
jgi:general secretion pathway protein D